MEKINEIAENFINEAANDYVGLWAIAPAVRRDLRLSSNEDVKAHTLDVIRVLLNRGLLPGDYLKTGFYFWRERDAASIIARIDREWDPVNGDPLLGDSSCWFSLEQ
jgi:hypothetical protein